MLLTRQSKLTGQVHSMELPITIDQLNKWEGGGLIQEVFPDLTPAQREFIMTGITEHEWDDAFFGGE
tara:strand:- start:1198 stop:1398 length:201 start_codon:yes stop_codon:yes gene_type:complete